MAVPGLVQPEWIKPGAAVVSVGTTFCPNSLSLKSDLAGLDEGLDAFRHASLVAGGARFKQRCPCGALAVCLPLDRQPDRGMNETSITAGTPGGVGPLSLALLLRNVVDAASRRISPISDGADESTPPVSSAEVETFLAEVPGWSVTSSPEPSVARSLVRCLALESHQSAANLLGKRLGRERDGEEGRGRERKGEEGRGRERKGEKNIGGAFLSSR